LTNIELNSPENEKEIFCGNTIKSKTFNIRKSLGEDEKIDEH
jgi:hypothetical protein